MSRGVKGTSRPAVYRHKWAKQCRWLGLKFEYVFKFTDPVCPRGQAWMVEHHGVAGPDASIIGYAYVRNPMDAAK
jgi:hypothetical protein